MTESRELYVAVGGKVIPWQVPIPPLAPTEVRVKVHSVAVNPIDWKTVENNLADGAGQGNDFSGVVIAVGTDVKDYKQGDTVAGAVAGGDVDNPENGSFTNILTVDRKYLFKLPHSLSKSTHSWHISDGIPVTFEQAASVGLAIDTTAVAFGRSKPEKGEWALIYGVTTSTGFIAAQYARNLGYSVIGVSAPFPEIIDVLGIESLDRNDPEWPEKAKKLAGDKITFALDCVTKDPLDKIFSTLTKEQPAVLASLDPGASLPEGHESAKPKVTLKPVLYFNLFQKVKKLGSLALPENPEVYDNSEAYFDIINAQLFKNQIRALPITIVHGLDKLEEAFDLSKKARGTKIVVNLKI